MKLPLCLSIVASTCLLLAFAPAARAQDADFAKETANLTRSQILQQAGVAILAQANTLPQAALQLLR